MQQHTLTIYVFGVFYLLSLSLYLHGCSSVWRLTADCRLISWDKTFANNKDCSKSVNVWLKLRLFWCSSLETDFWGVKTVSDWSIYFRFFIRYTRFRRVRCFSWRILHLSPTLQYFFIANLLILLYSCFDASSYLTTHLYLKMTGSFHQRWWCMWLCN